VFGGKGESDWIIHPQTPDVQLATELKRIRREEATSVSGNRARGDGGEVILYESGTRNVEQDDSAEFVHKGGRISSPPRTGRRKKET